MSPISLPVIWTPQSLNDLQTRYKFLYEKDVDIAKSMASKMLEYAKKLEQNQYIGRPSTDLPPEYRELIIPFGGSGYILLYEVLADKVLVLAMRHQKEISYLL